MKPKHKQSLFVAVFLIVLVGLMLFTSNRSSSSNYNNYNSNSSNNYNSNSNPSKLNVSIVSSPDDTVRNPYAPPVRHFPKDQYAQVGYLETHGNEKKVPLFGKPCPTQRRNWLYYAAPGGGIKLPLEVKGRKCTVAPGCEELMGGDEVTVDGRSYRVRLYETDMFEYNPFGFDDV